MKKLVLTCTALLLLTACATTQKTMVKEDVYPVESVLQGMFDFEAKLTAHIPRKKLTNIQLTMEMKNTPSGIKEVNGQQVSYSTSNITKSGSTATGEDYYTTKPFRYLGGYMDDMPYVVSNHGDLPKKASTGSQGRFHDLTVYESKAKKHIVFANSVTWELNKVSENLAKMCVVYQTLESKTCHIINKQGELQHVEYITHVSFLDLDSGSTELVKLPVTYTNK